MLSLEEKIIFFLEEGYCEAVRLQYISASRLTGMVWQDVFYSTRPMGSEQILI